VLRRFRRRKRFYREYLPLEKQYGLADMPAQRYASTLEPRDAKARLSALQPEVPWANYFDLGGGVATLDPQQQTYFRKAVSCKRVADTLVEWIPRCTRRGRIEGLRVLDIACGEGATSIELAARGAEVVGIDGRQIHVDRANFIAEAFGFGNARFEVGDCRRLDPDAFTGFDLVLFYGILHHLGEGDFLPMLRLLRTLTNDSLIIFMHLGHPDSPYLLQKLDRPVTVDGKYSGYLWREHPAGATPDRVASRIRSSLDNEFSFWPAEHSVLDALRDVGFGYVAKILQPSVFGDPAGEHRVFLLCKP
jgi:SAM-dependent methyltransferase